MSASFIWFLLGLVFAVVELAVPGFVVVFFGLGCWASSLAALLGIGGLETQIWIFIISSIVFLLAGRRFIPETFRGQVKPAGSDDFETDARGEIVEASRDIHPSIPGEIKFRGSFWKAISHAPIKAGEKAIIYGTKDDAGTIFIVGPAEPEGDESWRE